MKDSAANTRARIDETALRLFAEKGVDQTTTRDIAQGAGVAEGTLYRHYQGKDDMIRQLFSAHYVELAEELDRLQAGHAEVGAKMDAMIGAFCALYDFSPEIFRFLFLVQHGQLGSIPAEARTPVRVVRDVIAAAIERGEISPQDTDLAAAMVFGIVTQPAVFKIYGSISAPMTDLAERLARACLRVLND